MHCYQLAYYRLYGKVVSQYEPGKALNTLWLVSRTQFSLSQLLLDFTMQVLTKGFYHGRTEAMRSATEQAATFCKLWMSPAATNSEKLAALREATQYHSAGIKLAASGKGMERHLFALMKIAERNGIPTPAFFSSAAYKKLNHTVLSTSNCGNPSLRLFGFGPVVQDGFGIGYIIRDTGVQYSISSKHRQTERFAHTLKQTLIDMGKLLRAERSVSVSLCDSVSAASGPVEYCDAFDETYGEKSILVEQSTPTTTPRLSEGGSPTGFARVLRRQSSVSATQLHNFGQSIPRSHSSTLDGE